MSTATKAAAVIIPEIGTKYGGVFVTGITVEDGKRYLNITASAGFELKGRWGEYGVKIEGADSLLAQQVLGLEIDGHSDWAIPARDVQELQYRHFKPTTETNFCYSDGENASSLPVGTLYTEESPTQTGIDCFREGSPEAFQDDWYWSSTQRSAYGAYSMYFVDGTQDLSGKGLELSVRPVRRELLID